MGVVNLSDKKIQDLVMRPTMTLEELIVGLLKTKAGRKNFPSDVMVFDIHNFNGFSGHNFWVGEKLIGQLHLATLLNGGYVVYRRTYVENLLIEEYHYYDLQGKFLHSSPSLDANTFQYQNISMDPTSPLVNHLYNLLARQYDYAQEGVSNTLLIHSLEAILRSIFCNKDVKISAEDGAMDEAILSTESRIHYVEMDPVLKWDERQKVFNSIKEERSKIISTKKRLHRFSWSTYNFQIQLRDFITRCKLIKKRPLDNIKGMLYKNTLGHLFWFIGMVRSNLGYSIALAIYGPFTFYFITQPMNPHAMWAVGKLRNAYINSVAFVEGFFNETEQEDEVSVVQAAMEKKLTASAVAVAAPIPEVEENWDERMGKFKAMQIRYEGNLVFAARMGRLEQVESQYTFPLTAESAWNEIERYERKVKADLSYFKNLNPQYEVFLKQEEQRAQSDKIYIWKKLLRYYYDHPYIVMDRSQEQTKESAGRDYYVGRSFIFMAQITDKLIQESPEAIQSVSGTKISHVKELAKIYSSMKKQAPTIGKSLQLNSKIFESDDFLDTEKMRKYISRHWEILFLLQNKKQEASSNGLQAYTASVRSTLWSLQSIYSAKRDDILQLSYKHNLDNKNTASTMLSQENTELIESMFNFLVNEYTGIRKEFESALQDDDEVKLRDKLIKNMYEYIKQRDNLL